MFRIRALVLLVGVWATLSAAIFGVSSVARTAPGGLGCLAGNEWFGHAYDTTEITDLNTGYHLSRPIMAIPDDGSLAYRSSYSSPNLLLFQLFDAQYGDQHLLTVNPRTNQRHYSQETLNRLHNVLVSSDEQYASAFLRSPGYRYALTIFHLPDLVPTSFAVIEKYPTDAYSGPVSWSNKGHGLAIIQTSPEGRLNLNVVDPETGKKTSVTLFDHFSSAYNPPFDLGPLVWSDDDSFISIHADQKILRYRVLNDGLITREPDTAATQPSHTTSSAQGGWDNAQTVPYDAYLTSPDGNAIIEVYFPNPADNHLTLKIKASDGTLRQTFQAPLRQDYDRIIWIPNQPYFILLTRTTEKEWAYVMTTGGQLVWSRETQPTVSLFNLRWMDCDLLRFNTDRANIHSPGGYDD